MLSYSIYYWLLFNETKLLVELYLVIPNSPILLNEFELCRDILDDLF